MPNRFLKSGIRQSRRWNKLTWMAQSIYIRLITIVDDFGRYEGDPELLRSELLPYAYADGTTVTLDAFLTVLRELETADMVHFYRHEGRPYLHLLRWKERVRSTSRYPDPKNPDCEHLLALETICQAFVRQMTDTCQPPTPSPSPCSTHTPPPPGAQTPVIRQSNDRHMTDKPVVPRETRDAVIEELKRRIGAVYQKTRWDYAEQCLLAELARVPTAVAELTEIFAYRDSLPPTDRARFFPQSANKLLSTWSEVLDRARVAGPSTPAASLATRTANDLIRKGEKL